MRRRLEAAGWKFGSTKELLGLSEEELAFIEVKLALAKSVRAHRERMQLTQAKLAKRLNSSQSRVAKIEAGDAGVSMDLLLRALLAMGAQKRDLARAILGEPRARSAR